MRVQQLYKTFFITVCCSCLYANYTKAQDPHFSQYFSSPLTFNPALAGYFDGTQRLAINFRNQWSGGGDPYTTGTFSFDTKLMQDKIGTNDRWGLGVHALYDQTSGGIYKNAYVALSTAFNKGLDAYGDQTIGIGIQASYARNSVDFSRISFSNQFNGNGFDMSVPSGETINNQSISYVDLNAGLLYNYKDDAGNLFTFGASLFHILQPKLSFFSGNNNSLPRRYAFHAGAGFTIREKDNFFVSGHAMQQNGAKETVIGAAYGLGLTSVDLNIYLGGWLRINDAVYPYLGLRTPDYQLGFSYDITNSDLRRVKKFIGSTEISFIYFFGVGERRKGIPCFF
ncbi:MAG: PorP/SprF family type IX secretion system membrane protein [Sediminibacterium sp.]